jgi:hypothetical protein
MHENEHHDLHPLPNMDDKIQVAERCGGMCHTQEKQNTYAILTGKCKEKGKAWKSQLLT